MHLIDAGALKAALRKHIDVLRRNIEYGGALEAEAAFWRKAGLENALDCITMADTIDAEPVRHGQWVRRKVPGGARMFVCSACNSVAQSSYSKYCCNCGAKMDLRTPTEVQLDEADSVMMGEG